MDDPILFNQFLNEVAGFRDVNARVAILTFVRTFQALLTVSEEDIERFAKDTHAANGGLPIADRIVLPAGAIISLQAVHFEFRDRQRCNALPNRAMIQNLDADQVDILRTARSDAIERRQIMKDQSNNLTDMTIPKLTTMNYDEFFTAFSTLTERVMSAFDIPLSYILRTTPPGNYDAVYVTRELKLKNCLIMTGPLFQSDSQLLYSLFVQHIGTTGIGSTVVNAHKNTRNGRQCFLELNQHFRNQSYLDNKAAKAEKAIQNAAYHGTRRNFTLETYYTIMTNAFNDLEQAGPAHYLSDDQRVTKFENGLHQKDAVNYAIIAKQEWIRLPLATRTFDQYYNGYASINAIMSRFQSAMSPEELSRLWRIGLRTASRTLKSTTHKCIRTTGQLTRRYRTDHAQLRYRQLRKKFGSFYTDFLKSKVRSVRGFIGGVIYTNKLGFVSFFPTADERGLTTASTLKSFVDIVRLPYSIHSDNHPNFKQGQFKQLARKLMIPQTFTEPHSPWQNRAESTIGELKRYARRIMQHTMTPIRLWCFCYEYSAMILSLCANGRFDLQGRTPYEATLNYTPDISEYVTYSWYQWCWFFDESNRSKRICRWLGPANNIGQAFCSFILIDTAEFISRSSVIPLTASELNTPEVIKQMKDFDSAINIKIGNHREAIFDPNKPTSIYSKLFPIDDDIDNNSHGDVPYGEELREIIPAEIDEPYLEQLDEYIGASVVIPGTTEGVEPVLAQIRGRKRDHNGDPIGVANNNPILDTRIYQLEFPDGRIEEYGMNVIAEHLYSQVDQDGFDTGIFAEIIDFRIDEDIAIPKEKGTYTTDTGIQRPVITTKGWELLVQWKDKSTTWVPLSHIKESNPIETAEFAFTHQLHNEPAFKWWVHKVLKKRDHIIGKVKTRAQRKGNMKFGVIVPTSPKEALELDAANNNTYWKDAMDKEMKNARVAFDVRPRGEQPPVGWTKITCHMNFEVKIDLRRKARYVAGGHLTDPPTSMTYSTVVSRESVRIAFLIAALNGLDVLAGDIQNAYLNAPTKEKNYFYAGDEWGANKGRLILIVRALYGLKSSALQWQNHLADVLSNKLGFTSSLADPDMWYKPAVKSNGEKYYSYLLVYVDDILVIDTNPAKYMAMLQETYTVRKETIEEPSKYLGADISKVYFNDGGHAWTMSSRSYIKAAIKNVKARLAKDGFKYNPKLSSMEYSARQPFSSVNYRPELDTSEECNESQIQLYQNLIGVLRWTVELGRIDICFELSLLSKYLAAPRTGHLNQALHIFKYLDIHQENELTFDPQRYMINNNQLNEADEKVKAMKGLYVDAVEDMPPNAPEPRGIPVQINCFVDSNHAGDKVTRRSHTGIIIYINTAPIIWYSKRQTTVESSTFGSEFVALRIATEMIISMRYKLRMFGIPIDEYANVMCDNEAVFKNASIAESRLRKKHNSICFHRVREAVACGILVPFKVDTKFNLADLLTKSLPEPTRKALRNMIMPTHN